MRGVSRKPPSFGPATDPSFGPGSATGALPFRRVNGLRSDVLTCIGRCRASRFTVKSLQMLNIPAAIV